MLNCRLYRRLEGFCVSVNELYVGAVWIRNFVGVVPSVGICEVFELARHFFSHFRDSILRLVRVRQPLRRAMKTFAEYASLCMEHRVCLRRDALFVLGTIPHRSRRTLWWIGRGRFDARGESVIPFRICRCLRRRSLSCDYFSCSEKSGTSMMSESLSWLELKSTHLLSGLMLWWEWASLVKGLLAMPRWPVVRSVCLAVSVLMR